jgi:hypothetical protein
MSSDNLEVMASAEQVVNSLSLRIALQAAVAEVITPAMQELFDGFETSLAELDNRVTQLERDR